MSHKSEGRHEEFRVVTLPYPHRRQVGSWALRLSIFAGAIYVAWLVREIWVPLSLSFLIAIVLDPAVDRLQARGMNRGPATFTVFLGFLLIGVAFIALAIPNVIAQGQAMVAQFDKLFPDTSRGGLGQELDKMNTPGWIRDAALNAFDATHKSLTKSSTWLTDLSFKVLGVLPWLGVVPIVAFYALRDFHLILGKALLLAPERRRPAVQNGLDEALGIFAKYLRGLVTVCALNGLATWILLVLLRVPNAFALGLIAGVLYAVPYVGALLTIALVAAASFVSGGVNSLILTVALNLVLHQFLFDQIITPKVIGGHVGLHPILSIVALLIGNILLGVFGMIIATPIAACVQIAIVSLMPRLAQDDSETIALAEEMRHLSSAAET